MSIFIIFIIASNARLAAAGSGSVIASALPSRGVMGRAEISRMRAPRSVCAGIGLHFRGVDADCEQRAGHGGAEAAQPCHPGTLTTTLPTAASVSM